MITAGSEWLSFYVFLPDAFDPFLVEYLLPKLESEFAAGRLRRFFFIRYSEGGAHLRLRFLPARRIKSAPVAAWLDDLVRRFGYHTGTSDRCFLQQQTYNRSGLYFGETARSVYSELLNEQTSYFTLRLLRGQQESRSRLVVIIGCTLWLALQAATDGPEDFIDALNESRTFAERTLKELEAAHQRSSDQSEARMRDSLFCSIATVSHALNSDPCIARIIGLLRRTRRLKPPDRFVGTHALHLLCNKAGLSLVNEYHVFSALWQLATAYAANTQSSTV